MEIARKAALTGASGVGVADGTERSLLGSLGVRVASFGGSEPSAVGLPKNPPDVTAPSAGLLNASVLSRSPKTPPPGVGCVVVNAVPRFGASRSPGLPNREGVAPGVGGAPKRGVFAGSDVAFVNGVSRENGCIFDKSGFLFRDSGLSH